MGAQEIIKEHERYPLHSLVTGEDLSKSRLLRYEDNKKTDRSPGYYSYYRVGAEWLNPVTPLVVSTKVGLEHIDFLKMFSVCFNTHISPERLSSIYKIFPDEQPITTGLFKSVLSPLIILHFLSIVGQICQKGLKQDYVLREDNLDSVKGTICIPVNEHCNVIPKRLNKIYCGFSEYSRNCLENRIIKRAMIYASRVLETDYKDLCNAPLKQKIREIESYFGGVSPNISIQDFFKVRAHKLFPGYKEAIRLARIIIRQYGLQVSASSLACYSTIPFYIDMSILYELYVYGLLYEKYQDNVIYQYNARTGRPDFLLLSGDESLILDTKYKPILENGNVSTDDLRQLSGYGRDLGILERIGAGERVVDCLLIYPKEGKGGDCENPFLKGDRVLSLPEVTPCEGLLKMFKIGVPLPLLVK